MADNRPVADFVEDAAPVVVLDRIALDERVEVVDVDPQPGTVIVMRVVAAHSQISLHQYTFSRATDPELSLMVNRVVENAHAVRQSNADPVVPAHLIAAYGPSAPATSVVNRAPLRR